MVDGNPASDDDDELELEPVDPEILAVGRQRAAERTEAAVDRIDVDELYGDTGRYSDLTVDLSQLKKFRFTVRTLMGLTAVAALVLTLFRLMRPLAAGSTIAAVALAGGWFWVARLERRRAAERERRRAEFFGETAAVAAEPPARAVRPPLKLAFSIQELMIGLTAATVSMALLTWIGPGALSFACGMIALGGLVAYAAGIDPPPRLALLWWLALIVYLAIGGVQFLRMVA